MAWFRINDARGFSLSAALAPLASLMRPQAGGSVSPSRWDERFLAVSPQPLNV